MRRGYKNPMCGSAAGWRSRYGLHQKHFTGLSDPCQAELTKAAAIGKLCAADIKQNCAGVSPGGGRIEACVKSHLSDLSEPCKDALTQAAADRT